MPQPQNLFIDTQIFIDLILPQRARLFPCSKMLIDSIKSGAYNGWTIDFVLSEVLGQLKSDLERSKGLTYLKRDVLSRFEVNQIVTIIEQIKKIPNLKIFETPPVNQREIYNKVKDLCVQTKDALILISALKAQQKIRNIVLVTRDERFLMRGKKEIATAHPCNYIDRCPDSCPSRSSCYFYK